jgi:hypothetical protein
MTLKIRRADQVESGHANQVYRAAQLIVQAGRFHPLQALFLENEICEVETGSLRQELAKEAAKPRVRQLDDSRLEYLAKVCVRPEPNRVRGTMVKRADVVR